MGVDFFSLGIKWHHGMPVPRLSLSAPWAFTATLSSSHIHVGQYPQSYHRRPTSLLRTALLQDCGMSSSPLHFISVCVRNFAYIVKTNSITSANLCPPIYNTIKTDYLLLERSKVKVSHSIDTKQLEFWIHEFPRQPNNQWNTNITQCV